MKKILFATMLVALFGYCLTSSAKNDDLFVSVENNTMLAANGQTPPMCILTVNQNVANVANVSDGTQLNALGTTTSVKAKLPTQGLKEEDITLACQLTDKNGEIRNVTLSLTKLGLKIKDLRLRSAKFGLSCIDDFCENPVLKRIA